MRQSSADQLTALAGISHSQLPTWANACASFNCASRRANSACARFIGRPKEQIIGRRDEELYPPETARQFVEADRQIFETGQTQVFEGDATAFDSATQSFRVTKGVVRDSAGRVVGLFGISHDMTERRRAEEERLRRAREQAARAEAEEASRMKTSSSPHSRTSCARRSRPSTDGRA